jgi:hypothetical protein
MMLNMVNEQPLPQGLSGSFFSSGELELSDHVDGRDSLREEREGIAKQETRDVLRHKLVVSIVLLLSSLGIAVSTYLHLSRIEHANFENQFQDDSKKLLQAIGSSLDKTLGTFDGLAVTMVSSAKAAKEEWPFVTLPDFAVRLSKLLPLSDAFTILILPLVTAEQRKDWEAYALSHDDWVNESMAVQETWDGYYGPVVYDWKPTPTIHNDLGEIPINSRFALSSGWC